jgi:hypothetical protein
MSERDRKLLKAAGLTVAQAAKLLGRTPAAFYTAMRQEKDCFETAHLSVMVNHARRRSPDTLHKLLSFVENEYDVKEIDRELIGSYWSTQRQVLRACSAESQVIALCNSNILHLHPDKMFGQTLRELIRLYGKFLDVEVPNSSWENDIIRWHLVPPTIKMTSRTVEVPAILTIASDKAASDRPRGFVFCAFSAEEIDESDAYNLWVAALNAGVERRLTGAYLRMITNKAFVRMEVMPMTKAAGETGG